MSEKINTYKNKKVDSLRETLRAEQGRLSLSWREDRLEDAVFDHFVDHNGDIIALLNIVADLDMRVQILEQDRVLFLEREIALHVGGLDAHSDRLAVIEDALEKMTGD